MMVTYVLSFRMPNEDQWKFISYSFFWIVLLYCMCSSLFLGCDYGIVPGGALLNGVAPSSGEQPVLSALGAGPLGLQGL